jgi:hypothetical protein
MRRSFLNLIIAFILTFAFSNAFTAQAQTRAYRVSDAQVRNLINRLETRSDSFRRSFDRAFDNSGRDGTRLEEQLTEYVKDFENATDSLRRNFDERDSTQADVQEVLTRARFINEFMRTNRVNVAAQNQWNLIRSDLNTLASYYNVRWTWSGAVVTNPIGGTRPYYVTDSQVQNLLARIEQRTDTFRRDLDRSASNRTVVEYVSEFENATDSLRRNFDERDSVARDVEEVLSRAAVIDSYIRSNRLSASTERQWSLLRSDLNTLAQYYRVSWNWNNPSQYPSGNFDTRLTGTYRLNVSRSDNVADVVDRTISSGYYNANQRDRVRRNLERRLTPPDTLVISKTGSQVTLGSNLSQQVSFAADNVTRYETSNNNRRIGIRASATGSDLTINYEGDRMNDYNIVFTPLSNGQLRVTRRVYLENRNTMVTVNSIYDKIDQTARWETLNDRWDNSTGNTNTSTSTDFVIPNNTRLTATLDTPISTKTARDGDTFTMRVTSPSQYRDAIIEGRVVGERSGVVSGRANLSLNFDTIRMPDGRSYRFAGIVDQVVKPDGDRVSVNNEGTVRDSNQTTRTVTRAGIGAALGAIIGAIAGGGQGAAVGAAIGAGAGAGSVILQGRDNLELTTGTEFTITASAPASVGYNR